MLSGCFVWFFKKVISCIFIVCITGAFCVWFYDVAGGMGGPMGNAAGMVGMGNPMVPPYGAGMQNQMGAMGMGPQVFV